MLAIHGFYFIEMKRLLSDIVNDFSEQLVKMLPMDNVIFINTLRKKKLFPNNTEEEVLAKETRSERVSHFLKTVITRGIDLDDTYFKRLLCVMEKSDFLPLQSLAEKIRCEVTTQKSTYVGFYIWLLTFNI